MAELWTGFLRPNFSQDFEADVWSTLWGLSLFKFLRVKFGGDFETEVWLRFKGWSLVDVLRKKFGGDFEPEVWLKSSYFGKDTQPLGPLCLMAINLQFGFIFHRWSYEDWASSWICSSPPEDLLPHLSQVCNLISNEVESGGTVLVHCVAGVSRWRGRCKHLKFLFLFLIVWNHSSLIFSYFLIARKDLFKERLFCSCLPDLQLQPHLKWGDPRHS